LDFRRQQPYEPPQHLGDYLSTDLAPSNDAEGKPPGENAGAPGSGYPVETVRPQPALPPTPDNPYGIQTVDYRKPSPTAAPSGSPAFTRVSDAVENDLNTPTPSITPLPDPEELHQRTLAQLMQNEEMRQVQANDVPIQPVPGILDRVEQGAREVGQQAAQDVQAAKKALQNLAPAPWFKDYVENQFLDAAQGKEVKPIKSFVTKVMDTGIDQAALGAYSRSVYQKPYDQLDPVQDMEA
jgi:hypothetical protein